MGLRGDMLIETVDGPKPIGDLARICEEEPDFRLPIISWSGSKVFIVSATDFRCIGEEQIVTVELDDSSKLQVSPSSQVILKHGDTKTPPALMAGESLLPFYTGLDRKGHPCFKHPGKSQLIKFSHLVASWKLGRELEKGDYVSLVDKDKKNYHPNNVKITHNKSQATKSRSYGIIQIIKDVKDLESGFAGLNLKPIKPVRNKKNHQVLSVELGLAEKVYTATIEGPEVVAVSGVFVKLPCVEA